MEFRPHFAKLPPEIQQRVVEVFGKFEADPDDRDLHFKRLDYSPYHWSIRVTEDSDAYRIVGFRDGDEVGWIFVGTHEEFDRRYPRPVR